MRFGSSQARELAARESGGIHVLLLWHPDETVLTVSVQDAHVGDRFRLAVAPDRALDAFCHPFAYAAQGLREPTINVKEEEHVSHQAPKQ
jgi:hypothetical protein